MRICGTFVDDGREEYGTPAWDASMNWLRFHGLDPNNIPSGSTIVRDPQNCRILYAAFERDENGQIKVEGRDAVVHRSVEQGEAPPRPFPAEVFS